VRILHVTPHLPPDQAANALLPHHLGEWARERGDSAAFLAHPPVSRAIDARADVTWIPRTRRTWTQRLFRTGSLAGALNIRRKATPLIGAADVVHVHSNGLLPEMAARIARTLNKPVVLTLYGTEIWHYAPKSGIDLFTSAYRKADAVTFYSRRLQERARELGLDRPGCSVIYPPVAPSFRFHDTSAMLDVRRALGLTASSVLVNVKRLHPLAGQEFLLRAMAHVVRAHPDTHLVICGTGALLPELQAVARSSGVERHVTFAGLVDNATVARYCAASDLFVLPSRLEALPTVAVEALASGTRVISSDNPGGVELNGVFGDDVSVVPRETVTPLAESIVAALAQKRRTSEATHTLVETQFRAAPIADQYWNVYESVARKRER
jgi:glycosyltransferase involved in cell wall biosynthesis